MKKFIRLFFRLFITLFAIILFIFLLLLLLKRNGILDKIDDVNDLKTTIQSFGIWGMAVLFVIQFVQVTIIPLPTALTTVAGTLVFGAWKCFFISTIAILLGSMFAFYLGRRFGKTMARWIVGKDFENWEDKLTKGKYVFFLMMLFPLFPDDILCLVAGVTNMSYNFFMASNLITRPLSIFCLCFIGSGQIIPFSGWGVPVWCAMILCLIVLMIMAVKKQTEIENYIIKLNNKLLLNKKIKILNKEKKLLNKHY